jgi:hypothetical protein
MSCACHGVHLLADNVAYAIFGAWGTHKGNENLLPGCGWKHGRKRPLGSSCIDEMITLRRHL